MTNEQKWLDRGTVAIIVMSAVLIAAQLWSITIALESRREVLESADMTIEQLEGITRRLDANASDLEERVENSIASRARFEEVAHLLLEELGIEDDPFAELD